MGLISCPFAQCLICWMRRVADASRKLAGHVEHRLHMVTISITPIANVAQLAPSPHLCRGRQRPSRRRREERAAPFRFRRLCFELRSCRETGRGERRWRSSFCPSTASRSRLDAPRRASVVLRMPYGGSSRRVPAYGTLMFLARWKAPSPVMFCARDERGRIDVRACWLTTAEDGEERAYVRGQRCRGSWEQVADAFPAVRCTLPVASVTAPDSAATSSSCVITRLSLARVAWRTRLFSTMWQCQVPIISTEMTLRRSRETPVATPLLWLRRTTSCDVMQPLDRHATGTGAAARARPRAANITGKAPSGTRLAVNDWAMCSAKLHHINPTLPRAVALRGRMSAGWPAREFGMVCPSPAGHDGERARPARPSTLHAARERTVQPEALSQLRRSTTQPVGHGATPPYLPPASFRGHPPSPPCAAVHHAASHRHFHLVRRLSPGPSRRT